MEEKRLIRKQIFAARKQCADEQVEEWSRQLTERVIRLPEFLQADRVMAYADYNHEVMTRFIIEEAWKSGKEVAVGIPEPTEGETVDWTDALMIMPGVAFDRENHRVGYGGGFYDRFLEKHPDIQRVAVAFDFQILDQVPTEPTDICPQIIVTQSNIYRNALPKGGLINE